MRAVCTVLLIGCGFHSPDGNPNNPDAAPDTTTPTDGDAMLCASITAGTPQFNVSACAPTASTSLDITTSVTLDTTAGTSNQPGVACAATSTTLCIVAAPSITIASGGTLIARGTRPLALLAHAISIRGTIDVASHYNAPPGAGSRPGGCTFGSLAKGAGGGRGGHSSGGGGDGGDEALLPGTGGHGGGTFQVVALLGGCGGTRGGDGTIPPGDGSDGGNTTGGAGGGAVWLASDPGPLILGSTAVINASGASGAGASLLGHGGAGGGAGGLIVLQATTIQLDPAAQIFANGGPGGGGAGINPTGTGYVAGQPGTDPDGPASGGSPGAGGVDGALSITASAGIAAGTSPGDGAAGFPATTRNGQSGGTIPGRGGGGGGGGAGAIRVVSTTNLTSTNISPPPLRLP